MPNMDTWDALKTSDPAATKKFSRAGGFKGTSLKPIWMTRRMTEMFGACGVGWGMEKPEFQVVNADKEILVYCTTAIWHGGDRANTVYGVGGDKVMTVRNNGSVFCDDEAFKKAFTDSLSNAMKQLGMAADIHMGLHDDDKYIQKTQEKFKETATKGDTLSALKAKSQSICTDLKSCTDMDMLVSCWKEPETVRVLAQMKRDAPEHYQACVDHKEMMKENLTTAEERAAIHGEAA